MSEVSRQRILCLWLRHLPADRIARVAQRQDSAPCRDKAAGVTGPLVIAGPVKNALRLMAINDEAAALGLREGMALADARAMYPSLNVAQAAPEKDAALLKALGEWCARYTPLAGLSPPDSLFLDITGCAHLHGGELPLLKDALARLKGFGFRVRGAVADSAGCAWAQAHFGKQGVVPSGSARESLMALPLSALRIDAETVAGLSQSGFARIADIAHRPRAPLAARFGSVLLHRLDQAFGRIEESITPLLPQTAFSIERTFAEPIVREEDVLTVLAHLAERLSLLLEKKGQGARGLEARLFRVDGECARIELATSRPLRDARLVRRLFADRIASLSEEHDAGFGYDLIRLSATRHEAMNPWQESLEADTARETAHLIDRAAARLGADRVMRIVEQNTHIPEAASVMLPVNAARGVVVPEAQRQDTLAMERPLRLFARAQPIDVVAEVPDGPPARFRWRRMLHDVARSEGPERIAMDWWAHDGALTRDYFRVEDKTGARFWLYREGLFERETEGPRWFLHGVFA